jgi:hypothetical protein
MQHSTLLNPNRAGTQAEDLRNKLRSLIIGQNKAINQITDIYQTRLSGSAAASSSRVTRSPS